MNSLTNVECVYFESIAGEFKMEPCRSSFEVKVPVKSSDVRIPLDFKDICRACLLKSANMLQLSSKEEIEGKSSSIFEILMSSTNIQISENDGLPNVICIHCLESAKFTYCFKRQCEQADSVLKKFFGTVSEKKDFVEAMIEKNQVDFTFSDVDDISSAYCNDLRKCDASASGKIEQSQKNIPETSLRDGNDDSNKSEDELKQIQRENEFSRKHGKQGGECTVCGKLVRSMRRHMMRHTSRNFTCDMCGKSYPSRYDLNNHLKTHSKERPFKCKVCLKDFCHIYRLKEHMLGHDNKRDYICEHCGKGFNVAKQLAVHMRVHTGVKRHECAICHKNYAGSEKLKIHLRSHTGEKKFVCDYCSKAFVSKELLKTHLRIHTGEKPYSCDAAGCDRRFATQHSLLMHKPVHSEDRPYPCLTCGKRFARVPDRRKHETTHLSTGERYNCPQQGCLRTYTTSRRLKEHLTWHSADKRSLCTLCGKSFTRKSDLTRHIRTHTQERPFKCTECGVGFNQQFGLTQHLRKHSGESRFICDLCGKGFNRKCSLEKHKMVHSGTRNHVCEYCHMKFTDSSQLSRHKRTHTGERPYKCDLCDKAFSARSSYVVHLRAHTGERPYQCHFCDKACATSTALKIHTRYHTGEKPYACPQCGVSFIRSDLRSIHMKTCCPNATAEPLAQTPLRYYLHQKSGGLNVLQLIPQMETAPQSQVTPPYLHMQGSINTSVAGAIDTGVLDRNHLPPHSSAVTTQPSPVVQLLNQAQCDLTIHQFNKSQ